MHEGVDLQLCIIKCVWRWLLHLPIDAFSHTGVQAYLCGRHQGQGGGAVPFPGHPHSSLHLAHLLGGQDGHVVLIDKSRLLIHHMLVGLCFQLLTSQPEEHVLFTVFCTQECPEYTAARGAMHQLVKGLCPALYFLRAWWSADFTAGEWLQLTFPRNLPSSLPFLVPGTATAAAPA